MSGLLDAILTEIRRREDFIHERQKDIDALKRAHDCLLHRPLTVAIVDEGEAGEEKKEAPEQEAPAAPPAFHVNSPPGFEPLPETVAALGRVAAAAAAQMDGREPASKRPDGFGVTIKGEFIALSERNALLAECMVADGEPGFVASNEVLQEKIGAVSRGPFFRALRELREALLPHHYEVVNDRGVGYAIAAIAVLD